MPTTMPMRPTSAPLPGMRVAEAAFDDVRIAFAPLDVLVPEEPAEVGRGVC